MVLQMGQSTVHYWELGHRSGACGMEDNVMNKTCSLRFDLLHVILLSQQLQLSQGRTGRGHLPAALPGRQRLQWRHCAQLNTQKEMLPIFLTEGTGT